MAARFWVGGTGTWDLSSTTHWATSSGGTSGASAPGASDTVTFDGNSGGGTVTVAFGGSGTFSSLTTSAFTGTLDFSANNDNISIGTFNDAGTGTHTINMGNGTWTLTAASGTVWNLSGASLTLNANGSTILFSAVAIAGRTFAGNGKTYNNFTVTNAASNPWSIVITGSNTFANITTTNQRSLAVSNATTQTVSGALSCSGTIAAMNYLGGIISSNIGSGGTFSVAGSNTLSWLFIQNLTKAGAGSITVNNGIDGGGNTGITFNTPPPIPRSRVFTGM